MKRIKINFAVVAFVMGSFIALTQSSFTAAKSSKELNAVVTYKFNGNTTTQEKSAANYSVVSTPPSDCDHTPTFACSVTISGDLQTWLNARTPAQILAAADDMRD